MEAQYVWHLSLTLAWIFLFSFPSVCEVNGLEIKLDTDVFVAFSGEDLKIYGTISKETNQTSEDLTCYDPNGQKISKITILPTIGFQPLYLHLKNLTSSGLYSCKSNSAEVKWFLRVTAYWEPQKPNYTEVFMMAVFTCVLLIFSVFASVYVFRGHWPVTNKLLSNRKETQSGSLATSRMQNQNAKERKETEKEAANMDMTAAQSSSFYASLEPRPRSIYDVLDHSAANNDEKRAKSPEKVEQTAGYQDEGIFECVYENF